MIFITLGSQKFQFNRLLIAVDKLFEEKLIQDEIFAQIGYSNYEPKHFKYKKFLDRDEFAKIMDKSDTVITHGGTGAIIGAVKSGKRVIAVPRLAKFGEHVDDHQTQIVKQFSEMGLICECMDCDKLYDSLKNIKDKVFNKYESNTNVVINSINSFIESEIT